MAGAGGAPEGNLGRHHRGRGQLVGDEHGCDPRAGAERPQVGWGGARSASTRRCPSASDHSARGGTSAAGFGGAGTTAATAPTGGRRADARAKGGHPPPPPGAPPPCRPTPCGRPSHDDQLGAEVGNHPGLALAGRRKRLEPRRPVGEERPAGRLVTDERAGTAAAAPTSAAATTSAGTSRDGARRRRWRPCPRGVAARRGGEGGELVADG